MTMDPEQAPRSWDGTIPGYERLLGSDAETVHNAEYAEERIGELVALKRFAEGQIEELKNTTIPSDSAFQEEIQHKIQIHQGACERAQLMINELLDSSGSDDKEEHTHH
jgi:hypothetical protein